MLSRTQDSIVNLPSFFCIREVQQDYEYFEIKLSALLAPPAGLLQLPLQSLLLHPLMDLEQIVVHFKGSA